MTQRFVNELRAPGAAIELPGEGVRWTVRVQGAEVWAAVRVVASPSTPVFDIKRAAMAELLPDAGDLDGYVVKLRGFEIEDERLSLENAGALDGSTLLVVTRRKRPVR